MKRGIMVMALLAILSALNSSVAFADMECGSVDRDNKHYAVCWTYDNDTICYLCPSHYRSGSTLQDCRVVECPPGV